MTGLVVNLPAFEHAVGAACRGASGTMQKAHHTQLDPITA